MEKAFFVYLLSSTKNGTLYCGVSSNLPQRLWQHKEKLLKGFTETYGVDKLVWYEAHENSESAISREKQIKKWRRAWKIELIEKANPYWRDLYDDIL